IRARPQPHCPGRNLRPGGARAKFAVRILYSPTGETLRRTRSAHPGPPRNARMAVRIEADAEPIAGYKLIERLGSGGFGEVWKAEAPGGLLKAIKFVHGDLE